MIRRLAPPLAAIALVVNIGCATVSPDERAARLATQAQKLKDDRKLAEAADAYERALELDAHNLGALRGYVETRHRLGRLKESEARFSALLARTPTDAYAHAGLGLTWYAMGGTKSAEAVKAFAKAVELAPNEVDFRYRYGLLLVDSDRWEDARRELELAVKAEPKKARFRLPYALALARLGQRPQAVEQLRAVLALSPTHEEVTQAVRTGQSLTDPFRGFPQAAREQFELALGWLGHDSLAQAQQVLESLIERFPDLAIVHAMSGLCAAKMDDAGRAIVSLRKASELDPALAEPRLFIGDIYNARGRPDEAREHYEAAIERNPFLAEAYKRLAEGHVKGGDREQAAERYGLYLLLRPEDFDAQVAYAAILGELGKPETGAAWDGLAKLFPRRPEALVGRARWYFGQAARSSNPAERKEARSRARESLEQALEVDPENRTAAAILGQLGQLPD